MTNNEILESNYNLIKTCCQYQLSKYSVPKDLLDDLVQEICLVLLTYDNDKLNAIFNENHLNAFITGILVRQLYSTNSSFYRKFRRFALNTNPLNNLP